MRLSALGRSNFIFPVGSRPRLTIGITGASGFVGSCLMADYACRGHRIIAFSRRVVATSNEVEFRPYDLDRGLAAEQLRDVDILIHAAFERAAGDGEASSRRNIRGTSLLFESAREAGTIFVFLSTLLARADAKSVYGKHKYALESLLAPQGAIIIRPGLVVGDGGLIRSLYVALRRGFVPLVDGGELTILVVGTEDLATAIELACVNGLNGRQNVCADRVVSIAEVARTLAQRFHLQPRFIRVPWGAAFAVARAAERLGIALPLTSESLLGMRGFQTEGSSASLAGLGWKARTWPELLPLLSFEERSENGIRAVAGE